MSRRDPFRNFRFRVEIDGIARSYFSEVTVGDRTGKATGCPEATRPARVRKLPGLTKYGNITLKRGLTDSTDLFDWYRKVVAGGAKNQRKTVAIVVLDETGRDKARFVVSEAWPMKCDRSDLNGKGNEVFIELLELVNEGIERAS